MEVRPFTIWIDVDVPRAQETCEILHVRKHGIRVELLRARNLHIQDELAANPHLRGAQEGARTDVLCKSGNGQAKGGHP